MVAVTVGNPNGFEAARAPSRELAFPRHLAGLQLNRQTAKIAPKLRSSPTHSVRFRHATSVLVIDSCAPLGDRFLRPLGASAIRGSILRGACAFSIFVGRFERRLSPALRS